MMNILSKGIEMTYEIYCYKSNLFAPDLNEAQNATLMKDAESNGNANSKKIQIIMALRKFNPKLDSYLMPGYNNLKTIKNIKESHIVLISPKGDFATQITILNNWVLFSIPYWYSDTTASEVFRQTDQYLNIIRQTVYYYVYDPQAQKAYDPWNENFDALTLYIKTSKIIEQDKSEKAKHRVRWNNKN
ncbi:MAG: hypothetical protein ABIN89_08095 [Chitinophagaceae bacterium]